MQGRVVKSVLRVHVGPGGGQHFRHTGMPPARRPMQRLPGATIRVHIGPGGKQQFHHFGISLRRHVVQRGMTTMIFRIHIGARGKQWEL